MASVKKNFGYNLLLTFCNYLFPLITYPYVSRVLGVDKIGMCNFVDGIINYFVLFSVMGIGVYGVREIAKCRDNIALRSKVFSNLIALNLCGTFFAVIVLVLFTLFLPSFQPYRPFLWLGCVKLIFNVFLIDWFFQGLQKFKYITACSVFVRLVYVISVFVFVHDKEDAAIYFALLVMTTAINAVINWNYSQQYRKLSFKKLTLSLYLAPVLVFGYYRILTSMYTSFNVVFLGFTSGDAEVGYFTTATKLYAIIMGVFTAFTTVMVPKVSELLAKGEKDKLQEIGNKTFSLLIVISLPIIALCFFCADDIILVLSGEGYEGAYTPFRIVIFLLVIIGMEQIIIQQFLLASNSNRSIFTVSTVGACVGIFLNIILTPRYGAIGSAISWGLSEMSVLLTGIYYLRKVMGIMLQIRILVVNILWAVLYIPPLLVIGNLNLSKWPNLMISSTIVVAIFLLMNLKLNRNELFASVVTKYTHSNR